MADEEVGGENFERVACASRKEAKERKGEETQGKEPLSQQSTLIAAISSR